MTEDKVHCDGLHHDVAVHCCITGTKSPLGNHLRICRVVQLCHKRRSVPSLTVRDETQCVYEADVAARLLPLVLLCECEQERSSTVAEIHDNRNPVNKATET